MIASFNGISAAEGAEGQREMLAGGIAQALITTAAGMLVAIPALTAYLFFVGKVETYEQLAQRAGDLYRRLAKLAVQFMDAADTLTARILTDHGFVLVEEGEEP